MSNVNDTARPSTTYIYGLTDPRTNSIRYVGKADNLVARLRRHIHRSKQKQFHSQLWIQSLLDDGVEPRLIVLETTTQDKWQSAECWWISHLRSEGCDLTNTAPGGISGPMDASTREKMSAAKKGKKCPWLYTPEVLAKSAAARTGKPRKPCSEERRRKVSEAHKKRAHIPFTDEHKRKISQAKMGRHVSAETIAKVSNFNRGRARSEESKAKQRASLFIVNQDPEHRKRLSEGIRKAWARRKSKQGTLIQGLLFDCL